jgi:hypothetical protein
LLDRWFQCGELVRGVGARRRGAERRAQEAVDLRALLLRQFDLAYKVVMIPELNRSVVQQLLTQVRMSACLSPDRVTKLAADARSGAFEWTYGPIYLQDLGGEPRLADGQHRCSAALWFDVAFRNVVFVYERAERDPVRRILQERIRTALFTAIRDSAAALSLNAREFDVELNLTDAVRQSLGRILDARALARPEKPRNGRAFNECLTT